MLFENGGNFSDGNPKIRHNELINSILPIMMDKPITLGGSPYSFTIKRLYSSGIDEYKIVKISVSAYAQQLSENYSIAIIDYHDGTLEVYRPDSTFKFINLKTIRDSASICTIGADEYSPNELTILFSNVNILPNKNSNHNFILKNDRLINGKKIKNKRIISFY